MFVVKCMLVVLLHARMYVTQINVTQSNVTQSNVTQSNVTQSEPPCESGWSWFDNTCYKLYREQVQRLDADKKCEDRGADVISIQTEEENTFLERILNEDREDYKNTALESTPDEAKDIMAYASQDRGVWLGGRRGNEREDFSWNTGERLGFTAWAPNEPDNGTYEGYTIECLKTHRKLTRDYHSDYTQDWEWKSADCGYWSYAYVCEMPDIYTAVAGSTNCVSPSLVYTAVGAVAAVLLHWEKRL